MDFPKHVARILKRLGVAAVFTTASGTVTARVDFTAGPAAGPDAEVYGPYLVAMANEVTAVAVGNAVTVTGENFVVTAKRIDPRGSGTVELVLGRA